MRKFLRIGWIIPFFMSCAAVSVLIPAWLIRNLTVLLDLIGPLAGFNQPTILQATEILSQLHNAQLRLPWLPMLVCGAIFGAAFAWLLRRCRHKIVFCAILWILMTLLFLPLSIWLMEVNGIQTGAFLSSLFPYLPAIL